jgi:hypothetical protein
MNPRYRRLALAVRNDPVVIEPLTYLLFTEIAWCGLRIYMRNLNVAMDCSRFEQGSEPNFSFWCNEAYGLADLVDSLTVERGRAPGLSFRHKVLRSA